MLDELFQDFRISVRGLLRTPLFAVTVILTLALGIGTNTAIFSIVDRVWSKNANALKTLTGRGPRDQPVPP
jgi:hypothetical protein